MLRRSTHDASARYLCAFVVVLLGCGWSDVGSVEAEPYGGLGLERETDFYDFNDAVLRTSFLRL